MAAASSAARAVPGEASPAPKRTRSRETIRSAVELAPAADGHTHCALFDGDTGDGFTDAAADGHYHDLVGLEVRAAVAGRTADGAFLPMRAAAGHTHQLSGRRCDLRHDRNTGHHVGQKR